MTIIVAIVVLVFFVWYFLCNRKAKDLGLMNGQLKPCPKTPNCVTSQNSDPEHYIAPLSWDRDGHPFDTLKMIIARMPKTRIVEETDQYMHVEFRSRVFSFVDDLEFYYPENSKVVHMRSKARCGSYDFHVNRDRVEMIRELLKNCVD